MATLRWLPAKNSQHGYITGTETAEDRIIADKNVGESTPGLGEVCEAAESSEASVAVAAVILNGV